MKSSAAETRLYEPAAAIRVRRNQNTDTPLPPEVPAGQNPPDGAILYYSLAANASAPVTVEIADGQGKLIRRFSSEDHPQPPSPDELNVPYYWIRMPRVPHTGEGLHRFVWDLRYPEPGSVSHDYPISAIWHNTPRQPLGPLVPPGTYTVKLTAAGQTFTQHLTVKMDPRVKTSPEQLTAMFNAENTLASLMSESFDALSTVRAVREQIKDLAPKAQGDVKTALTDLDGKLVALEGAPGGFGRPPATDSLAGLNSTLGQVYGVVDNVDAAPTTQQSQIISDLNQRTQRVLANWKDTQSRDLPAVNAKLKAAGLPPLEPNRKLAPTEEAPSGDEP
ncbi:MAG: hypothetical protein JOZ43_07715 [Acidobacteriales bacterium]|nr:hypothetical protein [Terriglobales bacterium]